MKIKAYLLVFILILGCFVGCGSDDVEDDNDSLAVSPFEDREQILTVIIEKLGIRYFRRPEHRKFGSFYCGNTPMETPCNPRSER